MPSRNIYFALVVIFISLFIVSKTSLKDQIVRNVARELAKNSLEEPTEEALFEGALTGMADAVNDSPYTAYLPPSKQTDYMRELQGQYAGVGLSNFIKDEETGEFYFVPLRNAPAANAGLKLGERIVSIDDKDVSSMSIFDLMDQLRGKEQTSVKLKIRARASSALESNVEMAEPAENSSDSSEEANEETSEADVREVTIVRDVIQQDVVSGDRIDADGNWVFTLKDDPEIGYVAIEEFVDTTGKQTIEALAQLEKQGVSKVILDFRGNPGGFLPDAIAICNELLSDGSPIVETRDRKGSVKRFVATKYHAKRFQVAVLVDEGSASASEIVSAALQDAGVAVVIGVRSYGKGTIQGLFELPCNSGSLRMTTASFWRPSGAPIHRTHDAKPEDEWGVKPNDGYEVPVSGFQHFYCQWIRRVRVSSPEANSVDAPILSFLTLQTNAAILRLIQGSGLKRIETAAELGMELDDLPTELSQLFAPSEDSSSENEEDAPSLLDILSSNSSEQSNKSQLSFKPLGRAPYFDPQLDKAIDYLRSLPSLKEDNSVDGEIRDDLEVKEKTRRNAVL